MTRAQLLLALSAITGTASMLPASDCDGRGQGCCKTTQDDRGLLDVVDSVAGRIHSGISSSFGRMSKLSSGLDRPLVSRSNHGSCDCALCQAASGMQGHYGTDQNYNETFASPPNGTNQHPIQIPPTPADVPPSLRVPGPIPDPVPDAQSNPFADEPVRSGSGKVRGRTIQFQQGARPIYQNAPYSAPAPSRGTAKPQYGQQYNPQAHRSTTKSADYWSDSNQKKTLQQLQLVAPASSQTESLEQVFRPAYRVSLSDRDEQAQQPNSNPPSSLRPVPTRSSNESSSSRRQAVEVEPYEREVSEQQPSYENPLRR